MTTLSSTKPSSTRLSILRQIGGLVVSVGLCCTAIASAMADEGTYAQRVYCTPDAWRLCSSEIPDVDAVKACMLANKEKLSAACRATFPKETARRGSQL